MMLGIGVEIAFWKYFVTIRFHPLRWNRPTWWPGNVSVARLGPFSIELERGDGYYISF